MPHGQKSMRPFPHARFMHVMTYYYSIQSGIATCVDMRVHNQIIVAVSRDLEVHPHPVIIHVVLLRIVPVLHVYSLIQDLHKRS